MNSKKNRRSNAHQCRPHSFPGHGKAKGLGRRSTFGTEIKRTEPESEPIAAE